MAGNKRWTNKEIAILREEYGVTDNEELSVKLNRSIDSIHWKASKLNISYLKNSNILIKINNTEARLSKIEARLSKIESDLSKIEGGLPKIESLLEFIISRFPKIGAKQFRPFTDEEKKFMLDNQKKMTLIEIADKLDRTHASVNSMYVRMRKEGLISNSYSRKSKNQLTNEEINNVLEKSKIEKNIAKIARELNLDYQNVRKIINLNYKNKALN